MATGYINPRRRKPSSDSPTPTKNDMTVINDFRGYLGRAKKKPGPLPSWWFKEKRRDSEVLAKDRKSGTGICYMVEKSDIIEENGSQFMSMQLRMVAETVEGTSVMNVGR
jgi:hypothetical protein